MYVIIREQINKRTDSGNILKLIYEAYQFCQEKTSDEKKNIDFANYFP